MADRKPADALDEERGRALDRTIAFSDGASSHRDDVPLVLNLPGSRMSQDRITATGCSTLQKNDDGGLWLSFALSFLIVAKLWTVHHRLSLLLRRIDPRFIVLNLFFLACVVVLPFPTELLGNYGDTSTAAVLYAATMIAAGLGRSGAQAMDPPGPRAPLRPECHR